MFLAAVPVVYAAPSLGLALDGVSGVVGGFQAQLPALEGIVPGASGLLDTVDVLESLQQLGWLMSPEGLMELKLLLQSLEQNRSEVL